jgi:hypothetical protein
MGQFRLNQVGLCQVRSGWFRSVQSQIGLAQVMYASLGVVSLYQIWYNEVPIFLKFRIRNSEKLQKWCGIIVPNLVQ